MNSCWTSECGASAPRASARRGAPIVRRCLRLRSAPAQHRPTPGTSPPPPSAGCALPLSWDAAGRITPSVRRRSQHFLSRLGGAPPSSAVRARMAHALLPPLRSGNATQLVPVFLPRPPSTHALPVPAHPRRLLVVGGTSRFCYPAEAGCRATARARQRPDRRGVDHVFRRCVSCQVRHHARPYIR